MTRRELFATTLWDNGDHVRDEYRLPLPAGSAAPLRLELGLYGPDSGARLPILDASGTKVGDHLLLPVDVAP